MTLNVYCAPYEGKQDELAGRIDAAWRVARGGEDPESRCTTWTRRARAPLPARRRLLTSTVTSAPGLSQQRTHPGDGEVRGSRSMLLR
jgi:hypothetical protein